MQSLLISKVADLVTGGKASSSLFHDPITGATATVEIVLKLCTADHLTIVQQSLAALGIDHQSIFGKDDHDLMPLSLSLKRSLIYLSNTGKARLKSTCFINDQQVPLKVLRAIGIPLLPIVNAPVAANALGSASSRLALIDAGVSSSLLSRVNQLTKVYKKRRRERESLERDLDSRTLPISMAGQNDQDLEILRHWIHELSGFEARINEMIASLTRSRISEAESGLGRILDKLSKLDWLDNDTKMGQGFSSSLYRCLLELSNELNLLDKKLEACNKARESLGSLSNPSSARTALERTRQLLVDICGQSDTDPSSRITVAAEKAHHLLNHVETALSDCATFFDDDDNGLLAALQSDRNACSISSEKLGEYVLEWNTLARKHGISPYLLPSCHRSLQQELDGNVEARTLLPEAQRAEKESFAALEEECRKLSQARRDVSMNLSESVSRQLPSLGMDSRFSVVVRQFENPMYNAGLGIDEVDFFLFHENDNSKMTSSKRGGKLEQVASAGERARILLAIECESPGAIRALCGAASDPTDDISLMNRPVAVIYDEIDAHIGGRASVSVARMLLKQSESGQVVSITHSPSVAAAADIHICVQKQGSNGRTIFSAKPVEGSARLKELARMASGDMAMEEAEAFAQALIRDSTIDRQ